MRKCLTILAVACLLFLIGGYHLLYHIRLAEVKSAVKKDLSRAKKEDLTQLVLSPAEIQTLVWEDASEFRYRNKMYDVLKTENKNGQTIYWCLADDKETALVDAYIKTQNRSSEKDPSQSLVKLLKAPFLPVTYQWAKEPETKIDEPLSFYLTYLLSAETFVLTPPPKVC